MFNDNEKEPEDMFDATDKVAPQVTLQTDLPAPAPVALGFDPTVVSKPRAEERIASLSQKRGGFPWKVMLLVIGVLVVIGAAFLLSMKILSSRTPVTPEPPGKVEEEGEVEEVGEVGEESELEVLRKDTDKDGLTDEEEKEYGTSARTADTDSDGLFDREEIRTWETDPLNPDTDGDGYLDGEEVDAGYNPSGDGILREAPESS